MLSLDYRDKRPLYEQISEKLKELIAAGGIEPGSQLPSVRAMAMDLSINPNTIQRAYTELERQGYIYSIQGKGNFVADADTLYELGLDELRTKFSAVLRSARGMGLNDREVLKLMKDIIEGRGDAK